MLNFQPLNSSRWIDHIVQCLVRHSSGAQHKLIAFLLKIHTLVVVAWKAGLQCLPSNAEYKVNVYYMLFTCNSAVWFQFYFYFFFYLLSSTRMRPLRLVCVRPRDYIRLQLVCEEYCLQLHFEEESKGKRSVEVDAQSVECCGAAVF